jgi:hypothetical protein
MNEEWKDLEEAWQAADQPVQARRMRMGKHPGPRRTLTIVAAAVSLAGFVGSLWVLLHQSAMAYTFGIIFWSAWFSLGGYWVSTREPADEAALPAISALERRLRRLERSGDWLQFGRTLVGVETLLCVGFWVVLGHGETSAWGWIMWVIVPAGVLTYASLSAMLQRVRQQREGLAAIAGELGQDG